jgi:hypothetical protein
VPIKLVDYTAGYDSECAVLFPETVADGVGELRARVEELYGSGSIARA